MVGIMATAREMLLAERARARQQTAALLEQAREQLAAADAALGRLAAGRYGVCERCGQPIGDDRLAARPAARTCIRCAVLLGSQGERGAGPGRPARRAESSGHGDD